MKAGVYHKVCCTPYKMRKEVAVLNFLAKSEIREFVPKVAPLSQTIELTVLDTYIIAGSTPVDSNLNCRLMFCIGVLAKKVHQIGYYQSFGLLNEDMSIHYQVDSFSEFIKTQIQKWIDWYHKSFNNEYVFDYCNWIYWELDVIQKHLECCQPLFCHGDFDLKNIIVQSNVVTGLVDWEHAGIYCLEWELRKLSRFYHQRPELLLAFFEGYFEQIPNNYSISWQTICFMEAVDLLGHLRWCIMRNMKDEYVKTICRMHHFFKPRRYFNSNLN